MDELQVQLRRVAEAFDADAPPLTQWRDRPIGTTERRGPFLVAAALLVALLAFIAGAAMLGGGGADEPPAEPRRAEQTVDGVRMVLEVEDTVIPADEVLRATLTMENVSGQPLLFGGIAGPADPTRAVTIDAEPPVGLTAREVELWERLTGFGVDLRPRGVESDGVPADDDGFVELAPGATRRFVYEWDPGAQGPLFVGSGVVRVDPTARTPRGSRSRSRSPSRAATPIRRRISPPTRRRPSPFSVSHRWSSTWTVRRPTMSSSSASTWRTTGGW